MKVALINNLPKTTGVGRYAITLFETLIDKYNIDVSHILTSRADYCLYIYSKNGECILDCISENFLLDNILFKKVKLSNVFLDFRLGRFIPKCYDIYHITNQNLSGLSSYKNINGKKIITVHDLVYYKYPKTFAHKYIGRFLYHSIGDYDRIICISESTKRDLVKYFNVDSDAIYVIHHGVNTELFRKLEYVPDSIYSKYKIPFGGHIILHIGTGFRKNTPTLYYVLYHLIHEYNIKDTFLVKIRYSLTDEIFVRKLNLNKNVVFLKFVDEKDLPFLYNLADVFLFPSLYEGFGFPVLESMACGTPVVGSNTSSIPEIIGNAGVVANPYDVDMMAYNIYTILDNTNLKHKLARRGLIRSKKFDWSVCAKKTLEVYKDCIE